MVGSPEETAVAHIPSSLYPIGRGGVLRIDDGDVDLLYNRDLDAVMDRYARAIETAGGILSA